MARKFGGKNVPVAPSDHMLFISNLSGGCGGEGRRRKRGGDGGGVGLFLCRNDRVH